MLFFNIDKNIFIDSDEIIVSPFLEYIVNIHAQNTVYLILLIFYAILIRTICNLTHKRIFTVSAENSEVRWANQKIKMKSK